MDTTVQKLIENLNCLNDIDDLTESEQENREAEDLEMKNVKISINNNISTNDNRDSEINILKRKASMSLENAKPNKQRVLFNDKSKNKKANNVLTLKTFLCILMNVINKCCMKNDELVIDNFRPYLTDFLNNALPESELEVKTNTYFTSLPITDRNFLFRKLLIMLNEDVKKNKIDKAFPIEALKFFLTTYKYNINSGIFASIKYTNDGKRKPSWLNDYAKSTDIFIGNLSKYDEQEMTNPIFLISNELAFDSETYNFANYNINFREYVYSEKNQENYKKYYVEQPKNYQLALNKYVSIIYDGNTKYIAPNSIEDGVKLLPNECKDDDYIVLEYIPISSNSNSKFCVVDVLYCSFLKLPSNYIDRMTVIKSKFNYETLLPNEIKMNDSITNAVNNIGYMENSFNSTFIQIPIDGFDKPIYYYNKTLTAGVVGRSGRTVMLAFSDNDNNLELKCTSDIGPNLNLIINTQKIQKPSDVIAKTENLIANNSNAVSNDLVEGCNINRSTYYTILLNGVETKLYGINTNDFELFTNVLVVSLKNDNKINQISNTAISHLSEYREIVKNSEIKTVTSLVEDMPAPAILEVLQKTGKLAELLKALSASSLNISFNK